MPFDERTDRRGFLNTTINGVHHVFRPVTTPMRLCLLVLPGILCLMIEPLRQRPIRKVRPPAICRCKSTRISIRIMRRDSAAFEQLMLRQQRLLAARYDLRDIRSDASMSGGRKAVQQGVRVKLPTGMTWDEAGRDDARRDQARELFPDRLPPAAACPSQDRRARCSP